MLMQKPFIDFYTEIGFAPTGQQEGQVQKHWENRTNLYRKLGLHPGLFKGASVLEIGPGSGENTIDLLNRGIRSLKLVDGVPAVLESLKARVKTQIPITYELYDASMSPPSLEVFDIVICEGVIPLQLDPMVFFQNVSKSVAPGGIVLVTTNDAVSALSEILRRISAHLLFQVNGSNTQSLVAFFQEDFQSLTNMSRTPSNWVLDSIQNPWIGKTFSIQEALTALGNDFRPISMTPSLHSDLDWYKEINNNSSETAKWVSSYQQNLHLLIDFQVNEQSPVDSVSNLRLLELCSGIFLQMQGLVSGELQDARQLIMESLKSIVEECEQLNFRTKQSLISYLEFLKYGDAQSLKDFRLFWGRGQQYLCFERSVTVLI